MKHCIFFVSAFFLCAVNAFPQAKYRGVVKVSYRQSILHINATWNKADHTGNKAVDNMLDKFAAVNKGNTRAIRALESSAAEIRTDPPKYIKADGSVNKRSLQELLNKRFKEAGSVTVPDTGANDDEDKKKQ